MQDIPQQPKKHQSKETISTVKSNNYLERKIKPKTSPNENETEGKDAKKKVNKSDEDKQKRKTLFNQRSKKSFRIKIDSKIKNLETEKNDEPKKILNYVKRIGTMPNKVEHSKGSSKPKTNEHSERTKSLEAIHRLPKIKKIQNTIEETKKNFNQNQIKLPIRRGKSSKTIQYNEDSKEDSKHLSRLYPNPTTISTNNDLPFKRKRVNSAGIKQKVPTEKNRKNSKQFFRKQISILPSISNNAKVCYEINTLVTLAAEHYSNDPEIQNIYDNLVNNINEMKQALEKRKNCQNDCKTNIHYPIPSMRNTNNKPKMSFRKLNVGNIFTQRNGIPQNI